MNVFVRNYVAKARGGWVVRSKTGKKLSRVYRSKGAAKERLRQIEYFKHRTHNHGVVGNAEKAMRRDPSQTTMLRKAFSRDLVKRVRDLKKALRKWLVEDDELGLAPQSTQFKSPLVAQQRTYAFATSERKMREFNRWFDSQLEQGVLAIGPNETPWTARYVESAYRRGLFRAYTMVHREELAQSLPFYQGSARQFLESAFNQPELLSKVRLLGTRAFEGMRGFTGGMKSQLNRILADGMAHGRSPREIARDMFTRIDNLTMTRAVTIARTEVMHAHAEGQLDGFEQLGVDELGVLAEWSTAGDDRVCPQCADMEGKTFTVEEARGLIPLHPNCRCTWIPKVDEPKKKK